MKTVFALILSMAAGFSEGQVSPDFPFLTAAGEATVDVAPDKATININISAFDESSAAALLVVATREQEVIDLLKKFNISTDDITATQIHKSERRSNSSSDSDTRKIIGYEVDQLVKVQMKKIDMFAELMIELVAMNNVTHLDAQFSTANADAVNAELVRQAGKSATLKAENLAAAMHVTLRDIYAINSSDDSLSGGLVRFAIAEQSRAGAAMYDRGGASVPIMFAPKTIAFTKSISVVFRIKP